MTTITVHNAEDAEMDMINKAMQRGLDFSTGEDRHIDIYVLKRVPQSAPAYQFPGRLEYEIIVRRDAHSEGGFFMLMLQRGIGEPVEFHS
jgi:hypothetical protein